MNAEDIAYLEPRPLPPSIKENRIAIGSQTYNEVLQHLIDEAEMLDTLNFQGWKDTLAKDLEYNAPIRLTRPMREQELTIIRTVQHFHDDYGSMMLRLMRLIDTKSAWGEDPPSRTRRFVSNVRAYTTDVEGELKVQSYLMLTRSRFDSDKFDIVPCERHDVLRRVGDGFQLARREIILDQAVIGTPNLGIFL